MILDSQNYLADAQAVTSTAISANVLDVGQGGPNATIDVGAGSEAWLFVNTVTAATDTGSDATLTVTLESATDAGLTTGVVVHYSTGPLAFTAFAPAGSSLVAIRLPIAEYKRYLGVRFTVANGPLTAGKFDAFIAAGTQRNVAKASGFTVQ